MVTAKIIHIDETKKECFVDVYDNQIHVVDNKNIGLELNSDGSADMNWISDKIKQIVFLHRESISSNNKIIDIA